MALTNTQLSLIKLYLASFNRAPEKNGLDYWSTQLAAGKPFSSIVSTVFSLDVVKAIYPDVLPDDAFLTQIYINIFNKLPDKDGLAYWTGRLELGAQRAQLVMDMINAGLGVPDGTPGKAFIANRFAAAQYAVNVQLDQKASYNVNTLKSAMATVTDDPASVQTANKLINAINTGGLDGPLNPISLTGATGGYVNNAAKSAGLSAVIDLAGTNAVAGNTVLFLLNDALFPTSITYILTATDIKAGKVTVKLPTTANWGADGTKVLSVKLANVPTGHISGAGGHLTFIMDSTAPGAPGAPTTSPASIATNGINAAQKAAGISVLVSLAGTGAAAGDTVQLLLGGASFSTPVTRVLTAADIAAGSATLTIGSNVTWGTDGSKSLTARITDAAGNAGAAGAALAVTLDSAAPTLASSTPADNSANAGLAGNIVLTFSENVAAGSGNIVITNGAGDTRTIAVTDSTQVTVSGKTVTIKPTLPLLASTGYNIQMASGVITDVAGNAYAGISNATTLNFTTSALPTYTVAQATAAVAADPAVLYTLSDTAANLAADAATNSGAGTYSTGRNVVFTSAPTIAQLTAVDAATTGTLTYTAISDAAATLATNTGGYVKGGINVTVTGSAAISQLAAIDAANGNGTVTYAGGVSDTAANLATNSGGYVKALTNVTVTDAPTIAQLTAIDNANTTGTLTYASAVTDTAANLRADALLNSGAGRFVTGHNVTFTDAPSIAQLAAVDAATTGTLTYALGVSDTSANLYTDASTNAGAGTYVTAHNVSFTDAPTIAQLAAVDAATNGTLAYTAISDTATNLVTNAGGYISGAVNVTVTGAASIAQLTTIDGYTTGTLSYSVTDTVSNLTANTGGYVKAGINVTVSNTASIAELAAIDTANGSGTVTYASGVADTAANLYTNAGGYVRALTNVTVTDAPTIAQLTAIDTANTTGTLTYASAVTDTAANLRADAIQNSGAGKYVTGHNVVFTDAATIAQLAAVDAATGGTLTYVFGVTDTSANLFADVSGAGYVNNHDVTFTDAATIAQLTAVDAVTSNTLTYTAVSDTAANLYTNTGGYVKAGINVTVTTAASITELTTIDAANTSGTLSYSAGVADTTSNLITNTGGYVKAGVNVTVTGAASIADLTTIDTTNTSGTVTCSSITDTGSNLAANTGGYVKAGVNVTVSGAATVSELTTIDTANTTGSLTYTTVTDTFANVRGASGLSSGATVTAQVADSAGDSAVGYVDADTSGALNNGDTFAIAATATISLATVGMSTGDVFSFSGAQTLANQATAAATVVDGEYMTIRGTWASGTGIFTVNTTAGTDTLVLFDSDAGGSAATSGIVLIGVTSVTAGADQITL
ncbi:MAG TPA: Ig-like domain-containing protein [Noviherbaspirillum sp.]|uniref:Ig-like domain-containing protein n=1 Tax=Noviherbaspirillum sp. TaxID=1926288 RepID=UPI002D59A29F|nr:Ig-like domain-containing protein [Noviherbaspirillum sp.]HYD95417.1 Ig-like domain-containing protein [Noviherbaspirillum sp.]